MKHSFARQRCGGFTLFELVTSMALVAITATSVIPGFQSTLVENRLAATSNDLMHSLLLARSEAVKRHSRVTVQRIDGDWKNGWIVFEDKNRSGSADGFEPILLQHEALDRNVSLKGNSPVADYVSYTDRGQTEKLSGAIQMGTLSLCVKGEREKSLGIRKVIVSSSGRPRIEKARPAEDELCS